MSPLRCLREPAFSSPFYVLSRSNHTSNEDTSSHYTELYLSSTLSPQSQKYYIISKMAANESEESKQTLNRWKTTLISVIDNSLRRDNENAFPNAQGAIPVPPGLVDLSLWRGDTLQYLQRYIQYICLIDHYDNNDIILPQKHLQRRIQSQRMMEVG
jgi:hypothetical protein